MIDLRSDTVTRPSPAMRNAMAEAEVGDDVLREDPTLRALEERAAALTGKEAALFCPSGTFANQLALFTWVDRGSEVYLNENAHIVQHEAGASAYISGAFLRTISPSSANWTEWGDLEPRIRTVTDQHFPKPGLICLENALSDGTVQPLESMSEIRVGAARHGLPIHMDGARLFNAALSLGVEAKDISDHTDSLMFCLSKGLGAPVGSLLCGPKDYIDRAFFKRKIMGGGMRQAGVLAAAGLVALDEELPRLGEDHEKAAQLAAAFSALEDAFEVMNPHPEINMVFLKLRRGGADIEQRFLDRLAQKNILTYPAEGGIFRFVAHRDVKSEDIDHIIKVLPDIAGAV
ncbi:MAG: GntG family PLP-dependent aldolase [Spirochaetaceae bacterium]|nr:GntG family PLP-dependent aldolase [Spirochaetaceae bacterium]MDT8296815.1 GntG family PLP-dependent aldolase [Spirochaetaceae bacterium]